MCVVVLNRVQCLSIATVTCLCLSFIHKNSCLGFGICYHDARGHAVKKGRNRGGCNGWKVSKLCSFASGQNTVVLLKLTCMV